MFGKKMVCEGWWEQQGFGRQSMDNLEVTFRDGIVEGVGTDIVGPFTLSGAIHDANVAIMKHYAGKHRVDYVGKYDGEGTMQGMWNINGFGGDWMIRIRSSSDQTFEHAEQPIQEWRPN